MNPSEPYPSSPPPLFSLLCAAWLSSSGWIVDRISYNTIVAKTGDAGQPCEKPSFMFITTQLRTSFLKNLSPAPL